MPEAAPDYYNRLLEQRRAEYGSKGLSKMPPDFYVATNRYVAGLRDRLEQEVRADPTSKKVELTRNTYQRAVASARDVLESRLGKMVQMAVQQVNLGSEPANLLPEERSTYDALVRELSSFRRAQTPFLDVGQAVPSATASPAPAKAPVSSSASPAPPATAVPGSTAAPSLAPSAPAPPPAPSAPKASARAAPSETPSSSPSLAPGVVVRMLSSPKALALGNGETLELSKEDLVVLPPEAANILVHGRHAEKVEVHGSRRVT